VPPPRQSLGQNFSRLGRLKNGWAAALTEPDPHRALDQLRKLYLGFEHVGPRAAGIWLSFQETVLDSRFTRLLDDGDFEWLCQLGRQFATSGDLGLDQAWWPLVQSCVARGSAEDRRRADSLLTELFNSPLTRAEVRLHAATALARAGAVENDQLAIYAQLMTGGIPVPPEVARLADSVLRVSFDDDGIRLSRAYALAWMVDNQGKHPALAFALGLGELLLHRRPREAIGFFRYAMNSSPGNSGEAERGLLAACLQCRDYAAALVLEPRIINPRAAELAALCRMLDWLDDLGRTVEPPLTAEQLISIAPDRDTGFWRDYALGRRYLLTGNARQAREHLARAAGMTDPDVQYHIAWAHLLCQDPEGVRAAFSALAGQRGSWALGCLLLDVEPGRELPGISSPVPEFLGKVAAIRVMLREGHLIPDLVGWPGAGAADCPGAGPADWPGGATQAELLEVLRTALGAAAARENTEVINELTRLPLFARLPAAERLLWAALAVKETDPGLSRTMLQRAHSYGRDRAGMLLALDALNDGRTDEARDLLHGAASPKAELIRAWADWRDGQTSTALLRFGRLSELGLVQADLAMGMLELCDAAGTWAAGNDGEARVRAERAAEHLAGVTARGYATNAVPSLARFARTVADEGLASPRRAAAGPPWTTRLSGLAQLVRAPEAADSASIHAATMPGRLDGRGLPDGHGSEAGIALVNAVLRACLVTTDTTACQDAAAFLGSLADLDAQPAIRAAARRAAGCTAIRVHGEYPETTGDPLLALLGAGDALAKGDRAGAVQRLRALQDQPDAPEPREPRDRTVAALLADALDGQPLPEPLPVDAPPRAIAAIQVAHAAGQSAAGDTASAAATLVRVLQSRDVSDLIDLDRVLPKLCDRAAASRRADDAVTLALIVRSAAAEAGRPGGLSTHLAARCASAVGEHEVADGLWQRALDQAETDQDRQQEIAAEYGRFLCHRAVAAHQAGNRALTLDLLRTAAVHLPDPAAGLVADLTEDERVLVLLRHLFPGSPMLDWQRPGRYARLAKTVPEDPARWSCDDDIERWHSMAVLCREDALSRPAGDPRPQITATALWTVLLAEPALTSLLRDRRNTDIDGADLLRRGLTEELLAGHKTQLTQALAGKDTDTARQHLDCLNAVRQGITATRQLLADGPFDAIARRAGGDAEFAPAAERAAELLEEWGAERVAAAERLLTDPAAIRELPSGIDRNYQAAIKEISVVLTLDMPLKSTLVPALEWHNRWLFCVYQTDKAASMSGVLESASRFAGVLAPLCTAGRPHLKENKVLGQYFMFLGYHSIQDAPERAVEHLTSARDWDSTNVSAPGLLKTAQGELRHQRWTQSKACLDRGDLDEAERLAELIPDGPRILATELNNRAAVLVNEATSALVKLRAQRAQLTAHHRRKIRAPLLDAGELLAAAASLDQADSAILGNLTAVQNLLRRL
jgi:tetratricopeptide (TPR) repeat protein